MDMPTADSAAPAMGAVDQTDAGAADGAGQVLLTVLKNQDGTFTLQEGDKGDGGSIGEDGEQAGQDKTFDSAPALMKGILDCLRKDEAKSEGSPQASFEAGYSGDSAPAAKPGAGGM